MSSPAPQNAGAAHLTLTSLLLFIFFSPDPDCPLLPSFLPLPSMCLLPSGSDLWQTEHQVLLFRVKKH